MSRAYTGSMTPSGRLHAHVIRGSGNREQIYRDLPYWATLREGLPSFSAPRAVNLYRLRNLPNLWRGAWRVGLAKLFNLPTHYGVLRAVHWRNGVPLDLGVVSMRVVTTAGVNFLVDCLQGTVEPEILRYHGVGTGNTAEASGDTALVTESTTAINPDSTRATGSLTEGASANIFRTVGTVSFDGSAAIVEHGIFSQAATGGGTLLDRSVFAAINVVNGDSIQFTYDLTLTAGG